MKRRRSFPAGVISGVLLALTAAAPAAERFSDVIVAPNTIASGETYHGYRELRVLLENQSTKLAHEVTLVFPERAFGYGNNLSRLSRTVKIDPLARVSVPLWQPPLPANGNGQVQVIIDGEAVGSVSFPGGAQHMARSGSRSGMDLPGTILVSRSLNFDEVSRVLKADPAHPMYSASAATGEPDVASGRGLVGGTWMPDNSGSGPHWIELDFEKPQTANRLRIHAALGQITGELVLIGVSDTNAFRVPVRPTSSVSSARTMVAQDVSFATTSEPIKTVRLEFAPSMYAGAIAIDAVELFGPGGSAWASGARASSESTVATPTLPPGIAASETRELLRSEMPVAEWSETWLSYTPFDAIILNAADLKAAPPAVTDALWRYAECGGNLIVLGGGEVPAPWRTMAPFPFEGGERFVVGLGRCFVWQGDRPLALRGAGLKNITDAVTTSSRYWQALPDENTANSAFPVIDNIRVPIRGMIFIMLGFVIVIGPVNLIVLARLKRRTWLLWTIPAISFVTCLLVFVYSLFSEGITPDARIESLTLLDQVNRRAASVGTTAFYCPLTPSQGLFFGAETEAAPLVSVWDFRSGSSRQMDWSRGQHLERGWVTARVPSHFRVRKSETRRERIQFENNGAERTVMNGLGAAIRSIWVADGEGKVYKATEIAAGKKVPLAIASDHPQVINRSGLPSFLERPGSHPLDYFNANNAVEYLLPNTYVAELDDDPFVENGLGPKAKSSRTRAHCLVYGILEKP